MKQSEKKKPDQEFFSMVATPARLALEDAGVKTLFQLSRFTEAELLELHGMGPGSIPRLRKALKSKGLSFRKK